MAEVTAGTDALKGVAMDWLPWIAGAFLTALSGLSGVVFANRNRLSRNETISEQRFSKAREERLVQISDTKAALVAYIESNRRALEMEMIALREEFKDFQIKTLNDFVSYRVFKEFDARVMNAFEKVEKQMERIANRDQRG